MKCFYCLGRGCQYCSDTGNFLLHTNTTESNERYTPPFIIELARRTMGSIDTDPASSPSANRIVKATTIYTAQDNGLMQSWCGNVWCNPPFGLVPRLNKGLQELFINKAIEEFKLGHAKAVLLLLNQHTVFNPYFYPLWEYATCFYKGRVNFFSSEGGIRRTHGSLFAYISHDETPFLKEFIKLGAVIPSNTARW